jgi:hypothetical protein
MWIRRGDICLCRHIERSFPPSLSLDVFSSFVSLFLMFLIRKDMAAFLEPGDGQNDQAGKEGKGEVELCPNCFDRAPHGFLSWVCVDLQGK